MQANKKSVSMPSFPTTTTTTTKIKQKKEIMPCCEIIRAKVKVDQL